MFTSVLRARLNALRTHPYLHTHPHVPTRSELLALLPRSHRSVRGDTDSLNRQLLELAWPGLIENLLQTLLGVVDLIFVGQLGPDAIAGVGLGNQIMFTLVVAFYGLSVGNQALVAHAIGAGDKQDAQRVAKQSLILAILFSVLVGALGFISADRAIGLMGATPNVTALGVAFCRITSLFTIFLAIMVIGGGTLRGAGDTRTPMLITGAINLVNILLDYGLIFGNLGLPRLGAIGSAYATSIARAVGAILILYFLFVRGSRDLSSRPAAKARATQDPLFIKLSWRRGWTIRPATIRRLLDIGGPSALEQIIFQLGFLTFSAMVVGFGTADLAAMQIAFNIQGFSALPAMAFGVGALTLVGQSLGAKDVSRAEASGWQALRTGMIWMSIMGVAFIIFRRPLFGLYTSDEATLQIGEMIMVFIALCQPLQAVAIILANALRGAGDTRAPMVITGVGVWIVRVGIGYILGIVLGMGIFGVWLGWCADFVMRTAFITLRYRAGRWKRIRV